MRLIHQTIFLAISVAVLSAAVVYTNINGVQPAPASATCFTAAHMDRDLLPSERRAFMAIAGVTGVGWNSFSGEVRVCTTQE